MNEQQIHTELQDARSDLHRAERLYASGDDKEAVEAMCAASQRIEYAAMLVRSERRATVNAA
jgi:hypothetical protein